LGLVYRACAWVDPPRRNAARLDRFLGDAAAVSGILRSKHLSLPDRLRSLLEFESGSNDAMAVSLAIGMITLISIPGFGFGGLVRMFAYQIALGGVLATEWGAWLCRW
jgi:cell volume regulation protein A